MGAMSDNVDFVVYMHGNRRVSTILTTFTGPDASLRRITRRTWGDGADARLWFGGERPSADMLDEATDTDGRPRKTRLGRALKRASLARRYRGYKALLQHHPSTSVVIWNGIKGQRSLLVHAARELGREVFYFEEAPLPKRLTIDRNGVNFGSSLPRDPAFYTAWLKARGVDPEAWRDVGRQIVPRPADKRDDIRSEEAPSELAQERFIFCPLQVPRDSQITIYGDWIKSVEEMIDHLKAASQHLPDGWHLRIKEHPSSKISFFDKLSALESDKFRVDNVTNTMDQIALSHAVLNVNSSVGLQAFFFNKPVIVLGQAFYCFDKLATKVRGPSDLADILTKPEDLTFSQDLRNAFMSYLCEDYYPMEQDVLDGTYGPEQVRQRDRDRDAILATL